MRTLPKLVPAVLLCVSSAFAGDTWDDGDSAPAEFQSPCGTRLTVTPALNYGGTAAIYHGNASVELKVHSGTNMPSALNVACCAGHNYRSGDWSFTMQTELTAPGAAESSFRIAIPHAYDSALYDGSFSFFDESGDAVRSEGDRSNKSLFRYDCMALDMYPAAKQEYRLFNCAMTIAFVGTNMARRVCMSERDAYETAMQRRFKPKWEHPLASGKAKPKRSSTTYSSDFNINRRILDVPHIASWRDLSTYDMIVADEADWNVLPDSFRDIAESWVMSGGALSLVGCEAESSETLGFGTVRKHGAKIDYPALADDLASSFDRQSCVDALTDIWSDGASSTAAIEERLSLPTGKLILILLAFAIAAGPVAVGLLAKLDRRMWIYWTFPLLAVTFSAAVMSVVIAVGGIRPKLTQFACTFVDEAKGKAITVQNDIIVAPFGTDAAIEYPDGAMVSCLYGTASMPSGRICTVGKGLYTFTGKWLPPRWPVRFRSVHVRKLADVPAVAKAWASRSEGESGDKVETGESLGAVTMPLRCPLQQREIRHRLVGRESKK